VSGGDHVVCRKRRELWRKGSLEKPENQRTVLGKRGEVRGAAGNSVEIGMKGDLVGVP